MRAGRAEPTTVVLVAGDGTEAVLGRAADDHVDLALVHALARLQLRASRRGSRLALRGATGRLRELLALVGLDDELGLEPGRQPEGGEVLRADEVVQPAEPPV